MEGELRKPETASGFEGPCQLVAVAGSTERIKSSS
jgi:hypothetical protein